MLLLVLLAQFTVLHVLPYLVQMGLQYLVVGQWLVNIDLFAEPDWIRKHHIWIEHEVVAQITDPLVFDFSTLRVRIGHVVASGVLCCIGS